MDWCRIDRICGFENDFASLPPAAVSRLTEKTNDFRSRQLMNQLDQDDAPCVSVRRITFGMTDDLIYISPLKNMLEWSEGGASPNGRDHGTHVNEDFQVNIYYFFILMRVGGAETSLVVGSPLRRNACDGIKKTTNQQGSKCPLDR